MTVQQSSLMQEVNDIANSGSKPVHFFWECEIVANNETITPYKLLTRDLERLYDLNYMDELNIDLAIGPGTFNSKIYPYKDDLLVHLFKRPLKEQGSDIDYSRPAQLYTFRGTLHDRGNESIEGNNALASNPDAADLAAIIQISLQLFDPAVEQIRMQSVGGVFRQTTTGDLVRTLLGQLGKTLKIDRETAVRGVDMIAPSNQEVKAQIVIPHGTPVVDVPPLVQNKAGGIYSTGLGYYLQEGIWYVWPLLDITRFHTTLRTLTLLNIPENQMPGIERTYRQEADQVVAVVTGEVRFRDDSEQLQLTEGNGLRFTDARQVMGGMVKAEGNKALLQRGKVTNEFVSEGRRTGLNKVQQVKPTANMFAEMSKLARRGGVHMQMLWENSDEELVYPGMPVTLLYWEDEQVKQLEGVVIRAHHHTKLNGRGMTGSRHINNTALTLFMGRPTPAA